MNLRKFIDAVITIYEKEGCKDVKKALKKLTINSDIESVDILKGKRIKREANIWIIS